MIVSEVLKTLPKGQKIWLTNGIKSMTEGFTICDTVEGLLKSNPKYINRTVVSMYIDADFDWDNEKVNTELVIQVYGVA